MRFAPSTEHDEFARSLDALLGDADVAGLARAWAEGKPDGGRKLWRRLSDIGVSALRVPESAGGTGAGPQDVVVAFEQLGRHVAPGPLVESVVLAPALLAVAGDAGAALLEPLAGGTEICTVCVPPDTPFALDADVASRVLLLRDDQLYWATPGERHRSVDGARRLFTVHPTELLTALTSERVGDAVDEATLACAAQLLGAGERLLADTVAHTRSREQFGRPIGEFQAPKHDMADVRVALDFARPLVHGAAVALTDGSPHSGRDVSAAKIAASDAAHLASRTALQLHGAIGYTAEHDLGLAITKVRALIGAWGTPSAHRARVLAALTAH